MVAGSSENREMLAECLAALRRNGLLLKSDPAFPSVATLVTGEPIRGSWWAHPAAQVIFQTLESLEEHREVLLLKLVAGKDTFVHRKLWPEILAIGSAGDAWQIAGLSEAARALRKKLAKAGQLEVTGAAAKELELRLLARGEPFHTPTGFHAKRLESWRHWADRVGLDREPLNPQEARATIEALLPTAMFPWRKARLKADD